MRTRLPVLLLALAATGCAATPELTGAAAARSRGAAVFEDPPAESGVPDPASTGRPYDPWLDDAQVLAYVNGAAISLREVRHEMGPAYDQYLRENRETLNQAVQARLRDLVVRRIVVAEAERVGLQIPDEVFDRVVEGEKRRAAERGTTLEQTLRDIDITRREWEQTTRERILFDTGLRYFLGEFSENQYSEDHFRPAVDTFVTPEEIRAYGERHPEIVEVPERAAVRVIDLRDSDHAVGGLGPEEARAACLRAAEAVLARLDAGESFADLAKELSRGLHAEEGGLVQDGELRRLRREYRDWAFAEGRRTGDRSGPVRLPTGYLLLHVEEYRPAHRAPIEEWGPEVRRRLEAAKAMIAELQVEIELLERSAVSPPELRDILLAERRARIRQLREEMR